MGVQGGKHALNGILDQLLVGHFLDVVGPHPFENITEELQLTLGLRTVFLGSGYQGKGNQGGGRQGRDQEFAH